MNKDLRQEIERKKKKAEIFQWPCGCKITTPHSHLVAGYTCQCEKGITDPKR